ncbi:hypothetical protein [Nitrosomonas sp. H1_AOB3]|mgnify:FL=1|uniref:hypothetical protein n=1 Tax=Nitrosomonas sp. H1_AOB3 TaxID=2741553 RepID=UPI001936250C|nr:hypothetical protein [Nitrosomonas sp. H1_AOB3]QOJ08234.1 MAG: hypothetical protein HRU73_01265 [Nitrosomonas sp. H1_AOB3]
MTDDQPDLSAEPEEDTLLLGKVDSMLHRHRREQSSLMQSSEQTVAKLDDPGEMLPAEVGSVEVPQNDEGVSSEVDGIPVLTEQVTLVLDEWPSQSEISELLYFAFDAALRETSIHLDPAERLTLIQALGKRLPKNL